MPISRVHILKLCTPMFLLTLYQIDEWTGTSTHLPSGILPTNQKVIQEFEYFPHIRHTLKFCPKISKEESYHWKKFPEKGPRFQLLMTVLRLPAIPLCSTPICYGFDKYPQLFKSSICSNTHSNNTYTKSILVYEKEGGKKNLSVTLVCNQLVRPICFFNFVLYELCYMLALAEFFSTLGSKGVKKDPTKGS